MTFKTLDDLFKKYPWKTESKFVPLAKRYGFKEKDAKEFLKNDVIHDVRVPKAKFIPIVSKHPNAYQMDTFINEKNAGGRNYLMFININTRKAYAYPMNGKGSKEVLTALQKFHKDVKNITSITSDQDAAYLSSTVLDYLRENKIIYRTTEDNNHNVLGIINRFMRTIRDAIGENRSINEKEMSEVINFYNNTPHKSIGKAPNEMTLKDEEEYIKTKSRINPYKFQENEKVRIVLEKEPFSKMRNRVSKEAYTIDSKSGNQFIIKSTDGSTERIPGYRLIKTTNNKIPMGKSLKEGKRGIIEKINKYYPKTDKYDVEYEGVNGPERYDTIPSKNLREGNPLKLSEKERQFWLSQKEIPTKIRKFI